MMQLLVILLISIVLYLVQLLSMNMYRGTVSRCWRLAFGVMDENVFSLVLERSRTERALIQLPVV